GDPPVLRHGIWLCRPERVGLCRDQIPEKTNETRPQGCSWGNHPGGPQLFFDFLFDPGPALGSVQQRRNLYPQQCGGGPVFHAARHSPVPGTLEPKKLGRGGAGRTWYNIASFVLSYAERRPLNRHHNVKPEFLQSYLVELFYKINRRCFGEALFGRLLVAAVGNKNEFRHKYG